MGTYDTVGTDDHAMAICIGTTSCTLFERVADRPSTISFVNVVRVVVHALHCVTCFYYRFRACLGVYIFLARALFFAKILLNRRYSPSPLMHSVTIHNICAYFFDALVAKAHNFFALVSCYGCF